MYIQVYSDMSKVIPPYMFCVRCGSRVELIEYTGEEMKVLSEKYGYTAMARGVCSCGAVYVVCYQPLPASPTFSIFMDIYRAVDVEKIKSELIAKKS